MLFLYNGQTNNNWSADEQDASDALPGHMVNGSAKIIYATCISFSRPVCVSVTMRALHYVHIMIQKIYEMLCTRTAADADCSTWTLQHPTRKFSLTIGTKPNVAETKGKFYVTVSKFRNHCNIFAFAALFTVTSKWIGAKNIVVYAVVHWADKTEKWIQRMRNGKMFVWECWYMLP